MSSRWQACRELARTVREAERHRMVDHTLRPRGFAGLWRARAPLAVQLWVADAEDRLIRPQDGSTGSTGRGGPAFALLEAPGDRRHQLPASPGGLRHRWVSRLDRFWDLVMFGGPLVVVLVVALSGVLMAPRSGLVRAVAVTLAVGVIVWVTLVMLLFVVREFVGAIRSVEQPSEAVTPFSASLVYDSWSIRLLHAPDPAAVAGLVDRAQAQTQVLWGRLPRLVGDEVPHRLVVLLDGTTTAAAEQIVTGHRRRLLTVTQSRPRIAVLFDRAPDVRRPRTMIGPRGITWLLVALAVAMPICAVFVAAQEAAAATGDGRGLGTFGVALFWLVDQFFWGGTGFTETPLLRRTVILGWLFRLLSPVIFAAVVAAGWRYVRLSRDVDTAMEDEMSRQESGQRPTIGIVTALVEEFTAVRAMLDDPRDDLTDGDLTRYLLGELPSADPQRPHRVVLCQQVGAGNTLAAAVSMNLARSYPTVNHVVMSGIACGVPRPDSPAAHVRLGDIVVGTWGVVAYDHVDDSPDGERLRAAPNEPAPRLVAAAARLASDTELGRRPWEHEIDRVTGLLAQFARPEESSDVLFDADGRAVPHPPPEATGRRPGRPSVHLGRIGSADRSLRNPARRDAAARQYGLLALEMEGHGIATAGLAANLGWIVVRGISDYGDEHTTDTWRRYAALASAAYVRALLGAVPPLRP